jgi:hypothetical protein
MGGRVGDDSYVLVAGGDVEIYALGDGIDPNSHIYIGGGSLKISGLSWGAEGAIDADGDVIVTGGEVVTAGSWEHLTEATAQPSIMLSYSKEQASGSTVAVKDSDGNVLLEYTSKIAYSCSGFSSPQFELGETYSVCIDGEKLLDITLDGVITKINDDGGAYTGQRGPGGGGMPGGGRGTRVNAPRA